MLKLTKPNYITKGDDGLPRTLSYVYRYAYIDL